MANGEHSQAIRRRVGSVEELLAIAEALEREAAARYRRLSARMARQGDTAMAAQFETLATMEDRHVGEVADRARALIGRAPAPYSVGWDLPRAYDEDEASGATLGAYQALAFAVRNEERAFAFYTYVAAAADDQTVRALAEDLARGELDHASRLRRLRRKAFHQDRPVTVEIPTSVARLRDLVRRWEKSAAAAHIALADRLARAGQRREADIFQRLAAEEEVAAVDAPTAEAQSLTNEADGLRLIEETFDRLAIIGDRAKDEVVVAEAQRLGEVMIGRLALVSEALGSTPTTPETHKRLTVSIQSIRPHPL